MSDYIFLNPEYSELLNRHDLANLKRLLHWSEGDLVGEHDARKTWRVSLPLENGTGQTVYIRQEHKIPLSEILEDISHFRRPTGRGLKTLRATQLFTARGVHVAPFCGVIERRFLDYPLRAVAIQAQVPGTDLYNRLASFGRPGSRNSNPPIRQQLLSELGALLAKINQGNIHWPDLVAKHIYVLENPVGESAWRFTLIDIERAEPGLTPRLRERQMSRFLLSLRGLLAPTDIVRIARGYLGVGNRLPKTVRRKLWLKFFPNAPQWITRAREEMAAIRNLPDDQPLPEEELYERIGGAVVNMRFKEPLRELGLLEKNAIFSFQQGRELYKPGLGGRTRFRFETFLKGNRIWLYLKRVRLPKLSDQVARIACGTVRHSICWHERYMIKQLGLHRIPVPVVVAYAEKMAGGFEIASTLMTQGITGQSLEKFVPKHFARNPDLAELLKRRTWIRKLAALIRRFHQAGFCHRDLYLSHIFISLKQNGDPVFFLIDLARAFKTGGRKKRWIIKDLAALNYSAPEKTIFTTDRMRFLKIYLGLKKLGTKDKYLIREIIRKTRRIALHDAKHQKKTEERTV
jgi:tRNA A-37 threonylcarbamoyl transferase component Bud32